MSYKDGEVQIIKVDPFHPILGQLFPLVLRRIVEFTAIHFPEIPAESTAREVGARLVAGDPNVLLTAFVAPEGKLVGHGVADVRPVYGKLWVIVSQCKVDDPAGDLILRALNFAREFGKSRGAEHGVFETKRSDSAWMRMLRESGCRDLRHLMYFPLTGNGKANVVEERVASE